MSRSLLQYLPIALVLLLVVRRAGRARQVRIQRMWITPILASVAAVSTLAREPFPSIAALGIFLLAALAGAGAGYFRALHIKLSLDPETGSVSSKATPIGSALVVVFVVLRIGMEYFVKGGVPHQGFAARAMAGPAAHGVDLFRLADALLIFSTMMTVAQRFEIWRRAAPLIAAHKADKVAGPP